MTRPSNDKDAQKKDAESKTAPDIIRILEGRRRKKFAKKKGRR